MSWLLITKTGQPPAPSTEAMCSRKTGAENFSLVHLGQLGVVDTLLKRVAVGVLARDDGIVAEVWIFKQRIHGIESKSSDAALVPPAGRIEHGVLNGRVAPVQIRLLGIEEMVVVLAGCRVKLPGGPTEFRNPIVGRLSVPLAVAPDVPVAILRGFG